MAAASGNTQDCLGLPSFMVIKRSVIGVPWLHGVESEGAIAGVEVGEGATEGVPLFVRMVMKFSIHACCSGVNTGVGVPPELCWEAISWRGHGTWQD